MFIGLKSTEMISKVIWHNENTRKTETKILYTQRVTCFNKFVICYSVQETKGNTGLPKCILPVPDVGCLEVVLINKKCQAWNLKSNVQFINNIWKWKVN